MSRRLFSTSAAAVAVVLATPAIADEYYAVTPSGRAEGYLDMPVVDASDHLTNKCIDLGWTVVSSTNTVITCEAPMNFGQRLLGQLLMGNSYSTPPRMYYQFNIAGAGPSTRIQVNGWTELQMAFGQVRRTDMTGPSFHNSAIEFIQGIGGRLPPGTTFPNHVLIGFSSEAVEQPEKGLKLVEIDPTSPAASAGLISGDIVTRIARKRVKDHDDLLDALAEAAEGGNYSVEYYRAGKKAEVNLQKAYRGPIEAPDLSHLVAAEEPEPTSIAVAPVSVADELSKFAKLRDDGVITAEEFQTQKTRLLGQ